MSSNARLLSRLAAVAAPLIAIAKSGSIVDPGVVKDFAGPVSNIPSGYLPCDGSVHPKTTYPALYAAIGDTWNTGGEDPGSFRVPDLRGRTTAGADDMGSGNAGRLGLGPVGATGGVKEVTLTGTQSGVTPHGHTASNSHSLSAASAGAHSHTYPLLFNTSEIGNIGVVRTSASGLTNVNTSTAGAHTHTISGSITTTVDNASAQDAQEAHTNIQPTAVVIKIIKT